MALHILPTQQNNQMPWQWQLASQIFVPMISGAIERQRQRDENRKQNAYAGELASQIATLTGANQGGGFTNSLPEPEGYNANPWAQAYHKNNSPLTQFDLGTADLMPFNTAEKRTTPSPQDILNTIASVRSNPRFSHMSPDVINSLSDPFLKAAEAARAESRKANAADAFRNAEGAYGKYNAILEHTMRGNLPDSYTTTAENYHKATMPQPMMQDMGGNVQGIIYDPTTGTFTNAQVWPKSLTPQQVQAGQQWQQDYAERVRQTKNNEAFRDRQSAQQAKQFDDTMSYNRETRDLQRQDANRPKYGAPFAVNGKLYQIDQNGNIKPFMIGDEHVDAPENTAPVQWTDADKAYTDNNNSIIKDLETQKQQLITNRPVFSNNEQGLKDEQDYQTRIDKIQSDIDALRADSRAYIQSKTAPSRAGNSNPDNPIHNIISNANAGRITGHYREARKVNGKFHHYHNGTDLPGEEGEPIKVTPEMGEGFKVIKVNDDPNASTFGCYVKLEGTKNGKKVQILLGHMKAGSLNVKEGDILRHGDILGGVGSTGRSSGNHVHVEVWENGNRVNPETFFAQKSTGLTGLKDGDTLTQAEYNRIYRLAEAGQIPDIADGKELDKVLKEHNITVEQSAPPQASEQNEAQEKMRQIIAENKNDRYMGGAPIVSPSASASGAIPQPAHSPNWNLPVPTTTGSNVPAINTANAASGIGRTIFSRLGIPTALAIATDMIWPKAAGELPEELQNNVDAVSGAAPAPQAQLNSPLSSDVTPTNQASTSQDFADVLREARAGMPQYDLSNAEFTASLPESGVVPRAARRVDPDGGLGQHRAESDTSPVTWRNKSGQPMRTSDGQLFTQNIYEDWKRQADAGHFKDVGINNAEDLNRWLEKIGMRPDRPSEQRGINDLNGNSRANANLPTEDENITPFNITPSTSPEKFQAPEFTDEINGTTPSATQDLLDGLNGITDSRYRRWTEALRRYYPSVASQNTPSFAPDISQQPVPQAPQQAIPTPQQPAPQQPTAPKPRAGYTNYEQQRSAVDSSAKRHGVDSALIRAIIETESGWRPNARSKVGAMGLMQLMPKTAKWLGVKNAYDPAQNIEGGSKYIAQLIRQFGGDVSKALMAYNCGAGNVKKGRIPAESKRYAQKVLSIYRRLKGQR